MCRFSSQILIKMKIKDVANNLCNYDTRNLDGVITYLTEEEIKEEGLTAKAKENCACDNCFYGRTPLAEYIIKLKSEISSTIALS
jgi:hypothetical protein